MAKIYLSHFDYEKNQATQNIKNNIEHLEKQIELLKSISRTHKKDGSDFAMILKNFESPKARLYFAGIWGDRLEIHGLGVEVAFYMAKELNASEIWEGIKNKIVSLEECKHAHEIELAEFDTKAEIIKNKLEDLQAFFDTLTDSEGYEFKRVIKNLL